MENDEPKKKSTKKMVKCLRGKPYSRNLNTTKITQAQLDIIKRFLEQQERLSGRKLEDLLAQTLSRDQVKFKAKFQSNTNLMNSQLIAGF